MSDMPELKPCPCCGGKPTFDYRDTSVFCVKCGMQTACSTDEKRANEVWNRRADLAGGFQPQPSEPWELLAEIHTVAVMNNGALPGHQMRKMKEALEAYPATAQPRDPAPLIEALERIDELTNLHGDWIIEIAEVAREALAAYRKGGKF